MCTFSSPLFCWNCLEQPKWRQELSFESYELVGLFVVSLAPLVCVNLSVLDILEEHFYIVNHFDCHIVFQILHTTKMLAFFVLTMASGSASWIKIKFFMTYVFFYNGSWYVKGHTVGKNSIPANIHQEIIYTIVSSFYRFGATVYY